PARTRSCCRRNACSQMAPSPRFDYLPLSFIVRRRRACRSLGSPDLPTPASWCPSWPAFAVDARGARLHGLRLAIAVFFLERCGHAYPSFSWDFERVDDEQALTPRGGRTGI